MDNLHHIEHERKWHIPADQCPALAAALRATCGPAVVLNQDNRFFDSGDERLRAAGGSLRLRRENDRLVVTSKRHLGQHDGDHAQEEHEYRINTCVSPLLADPNWNPAAYLPLPAWIRAALGGATLRCFGGFSNRRLAWQRGDEEIALDHVTFPGDHHDYELEVERPSADLDHDWWQRFFTDHHLTPTTQPLTKLHRFVAHVAASAS
ncbi:MAG: CYTH domain-containing protein [Planctomycetota bacterium]